MIGRELEQVARFGADEFLVEFGDHSPAADLVRPVFDVEPGKRFVAPPTPEVDADVVAVDRRAIYVGQFSERLTQTIDLRVDFLVGGCWAHELDAQAPVARHGDLWSNFDGCVERHRALFGTGREIDLWRRDEIDVV